MYTEETGLLSGGTLKNRRVQDALGAKRAESLPSIQNTPTAPVNNRNSLYICLLKDLWHETRVLLFFLREVPTEHFPCESACLLVIGYVVSGIKLNLVLQLLGQVLLFGNWVFENGRFLGSSSAIGRFCKYSCSEEAVVHCVHSCITRLLSSSMGSTLATDMSRWKWKYQGQVWYNYEVGYTRLTYIRINRRMRSLHSTFLLSYN